MEACERCGAMAHGNITCDTCRTVLNRKYGWTLPLTGREPEPPCDEEAIQGFLAKLDRLHGHPETGKPAVPPVTVAPFD